MNVGLGHTARGVSKQGSDRQFREAKITCNAREGMAERVRGHVRQSRGTTYPFEYPHDADEMPVSPVCREYIRRAVSDRLRENEIDGGLAHDAHLRAGLGFWKPNGPLFRIHPGALEAKALHAPESREQQEPDRGKPRWVLTLGGEGTHGFTEARDLGGAQAPLSRRAG